MAKSVNTLSSVSRWADSAIYRECLSAEWDLQPDDWKRFTLKRSGIPEKYSESNLPLIIKIAKQDQREKLLDRVSKSMRDSYDGIKTKMMVMEFSDGKSRMVPFVIPMRPVDIGDKPIPRDGYIAEEKKDGSLTLQYINDGAVAYVNRAARVKTGIYPELIDEKEIEKIKTKGLTIIEGEAYALSGGTDSFEAFLKRDLLQNPEEAINRQKEFPLKYDAFDIVMKDGEWLDCLPLDKRKEVLDQTIPDNLKNIKKIKYYKDTESVTNRLKKDPTAEGVVYKKLDSRYSSQDGSDWYKKKFHKQADVVIMGYEKGEGKRKDIGALKVGVWDKKKNEVIEVANVGTGFTDVELADMKRKIDRGERLFAKINYMKVGTQGRLRVPSFAGLREDIGIRDTHL